MIPDDINDFAEQFAPDDPAIQKRIAAAITAYIAALPQGAAAAGVKVKPLEWDDLTSPREDGPHEPTGDVAAETMIGYYSVCFDPDEDAVAAPWCAWSANECIGHFATLDAANAAAHADYSQRILSALEQAEAGEDALMAAKDEGVNFVFDHLAKALGLEQWVGKDGSEEWDGDVLATLYGILHDAKVLDDDNRRVSPSPNAGADAGEREAAKTLVQTWRKFIEERPQLLSFLYDVDMMPEQIVSMRGARSLDAVCSLYQSAEEGGIPLRTASPVPETADMVRVKQAVLKKLKDWVEFEREAGDRVLRIEMEAVSVLIGFYERAIAASNTKRGE